MNSIKKLIQEKLEEIDGQLKLHDIKMLSGGCINSASELITNKGSFFAKWNTSATPDIFLAEAEGLRAMRKATQSLVIPEVFVATEIKPNESGLLITEFLKPGTPDDESLGEGLAEIHRYSAESFGFARTTYCGATPQDNTWRSDWVSFYGEQRLGFLVQLIDKQRGLGKQEKTTYEQLIAKLPEHLPQHSTPALIHGDLWSGNYLYTAKGAALIDPACCFADREFEFGIAKMFGGFSSRFWEAYQYNYPLEKGWEFRNNLYQLYHYLNHDYLFGGSYGSAALAIAKQFI